MRPNIFRASFSAINDRIAINITRIWKRMTVSSGRLITRI
jgi:hypothetical protein